MMRTSEIVHFVTAFVVVVAMVCATVIALHDGHDAQAAVAVLTAGIGWAGGHAHASYTRRRTDSRVPPTGP